jgi:ATP-dependent DNA helicase RecG
MQETSNLDRKSLKIISGKTADWKEIAKDCVCLANYRGGTLYIGIEDDCILPPENQLIDIRLLDQINKRIAELTINVAIKPSIKTSENSGQYIELKVFQSTSTIASTTDGKYFIRIADNCKPLLPDELSRLLTDKPSYIWETKTLKSVKRNDYDEQKFNAFLLEIRASDRISAFIKSKSDDEILDYYLFTDGAYLTNLGVLWIGRRIDRAKLLYSPVIQFLKYDENLNRVNKIVWDDYSLNPKELIESIWTQIPDWKEGIEISDGIFRKFIPNYEEEVVREIIVNALVHRPYTTRGDIFINLYHDHLEVRNPGLLPLGVTPDNILHKTIRRNEHLTKVFYDMKLMEREGSGYDKLFEVLLRNGKHIPTVVEKDDSVCVIIKKSMVKSEVVNLINRVQVDFALNQREIICFGLIAQNTTLSSIEFSKILNLDSLNSMRDWSGRLMELGLVLTKGKTKGVEYYINPELLRDVKYQGQTNLKKIESHRLKELIYQDLKTYSNSSTSEIHNRIGSEIPIRKIKDFLYKMVKSNEINVSGKLRWAKYSINKNYVK